MANGIYENSTGDLIKAGLSDFVAQSGQTLRSDVPEPFFVRGTSGNANMHRWNGSAWVEVTNVFPNIISPSNTTHLLINDNETSSKSGIFGDIKTVRFYLSEHFSPSFFFVQYEVKVDSGETGLVQIIIDDEATPRYTSDPITNTDYQFQIAEKIDISDLSFGVHTFKMMTKSSTGTKLTFLKFINIIFIF